MKVFLSKIIIDSQKMKQVKKQIKLLPIIKKTFPYFKTRGIVFTFSIVIYTFYSCIFVPSINRCIFVSLHRHIFALSIVIFSIVISLYPHIFIFSIVVSSYCCIIVSSHFLSLYFRLSYLRIFNRCIFNRRIFNCCIFDRWIFVLSYLPIIVSLYCPIVVSIVVVSSHSLIFVISIVVSLYF